MIPDDRYAFAASMPAYLGWRSEVDGSDPPAHAQRPVDTDLGLEEALRLPVVPFGARAPVVIPARVDVPLQAAPFSFLGFDDVVPVYAAPYLGEYQVLRPLDVDLEEVQRAPSHFVAAEEFAPGAPLRVLLSGWHLYPLGEDHALAPSFGWIARLLGVLHWLVEPRIDATMEGLEVAGRRPSDYVDLVRVDPPCAVVGGGNLHALICLAWYAVADESRRLAAALRACPARARGEDGVLGVDAGLRDALAGLGPVPGHPLQAWSARRCPFSEPADVFVWGGRPPVNVVRGLHDTLEALGGLASGRSSASWRKPSAIRGRVRERMWDDLLRRNVHVYGDFSRRLLRTAALAVRLLSHVVYRTIVFYMNGPLWDPRDAPHEYLPALDLLACSPLERLHTLPDEFALECALPRRLLWVLEGDLHMHAVRWAPLALHRHWGIPPDRPDALDRAGALCPAGSFYLRHPTLPPDELRAQLGAGVQ